MQFALLNFSRRCVRGFAFLLCDAVLLG